MKPEITRLKIAVALTRSEWDHLQAREKIWDKHHSKYWPDTWKFSCNDKIDDYEWNGMFGMNIFFQAVPGFEKYFYAFLKQLLQTRPSYFEGLKQGESGMDMEIPKGLRELDRLLFEKGWTAGQQMGWDAALNAYDYDYKK